MKGRPKSKKPRKQRKYLAEAPLGKRQKMVASTLSEELRAKYGRRSLSVRKGDKVKIMRGDFKGASGEVTKVTLRSYKINVDGVNVKKADGTDVPKPLHPSNVMITGLYLEDKERRDLLDRKAKKA